MKKVFYLIVLCMVLPLFGAEKELLRIETTYTGRLAQDVSKLGNCIAPHLQDSLAGGMMALAFAGFQFGMDATRPLLFTFYSFGDEPRVRLTAYMIPDMKPQRNSVKLWGVRFRVRQVGNVAVLESGKIDAPVQQPGQTLEKNERFRITFLAGEVRKHFQFASIRTSDPQRRLALQGLDEVMKQVDLLECSFYADKLLSFRLTALARSGSETEKWMKRPLPAKIPLQVFPGAQSAAVLRMNPTDTLLRYGSAYCGNLIPQNLLSSLTGTVICSYSPDFLRVDAGLKPGKAKEVKKIISSMEYTPFPGLSRLRKKPPVLMGSSGNTLSLYAMYEMTPEKIKTICQQKTSTLPMKDYPFAVYDLQNSCVPCHLLFSGRKMVLTLEGTPEYFQTFTPLIGEELHSINWDHLPSKAGL